MDITITQTAVICVFIFFAGFVDSIAGGGGLISLPAYFAIGLPPHVALATNKFSGFMGTLTSSIRYYRAGVMNVRIGLTGAAGALAGSALGARVALWLSESVINGIMLALVPTVMVFLLLKDRILPAQANSVDDAPAKALYIKAFAVAVVVGFYDGIFGPGTGAFLTIAFFTVLGFNLITSSANARLANLASNFGALTVFLISGKVLFPLALFAAAAGIAGNILGSRLALKKQDRIIKPLLIGVLVLLMAEVVRRQIIMP